MVDRSRLLALLGGVPFFLRWMDVHKPFTEFIPCLGQPLGLGLEACVVGVQDILAFWTMLNAGQLSVMLETKSHWFAHLQ